jgi:hypothetical protein
MNSIILSHLGESVPPYINDCIHQLRLWNPALTIYLILDSFHRKSYNPVDIYSSYIDSLSPPSLWEKLVKDYSIIIIFTDTLTPTQDHTSFKEHIHLASAFDLNFRKGYWKFVRERFFFIEELILQYNLTHSISMEYDVLVYVNLEPLFEKLRESHQTLRFVKDNESRGHPGFLYIPNLNSISEYNRFLLTTIHTHNKIDDMISLAIYSNEYQERVHYFPVITEASNNKIPLRKSLNSFYRSSNPYFLSEDSEYFQCLFDSAVVGQWVSGIDPRNTGGRKLSQFLNDSALYLINEVSFEWVKLESKWVPILDGRILATIHVHSKALNNLLSDRLECPSDDYDVDAVLKQLEPN